jgi:hypothetical protein
MITVESTITLQACGHLSSRKERAVGMKTLFFSLAVITSNKLQVLYFSFWIVSAGQNITIKRARLFIYSFGDAGD